MDYEVAIAPPSGGEADHVAAIHNATYIPRVGEYMCLLGDEPGRRHVFRVL